MRGFRRLRRVWRRPGATERPLADAHTADYGDKLEGFAHFAATELAALVGVLGVSQDSRVLDVGCGTGFMLPILERHVGPTGLVVGLDLARAHLARTGGRGARLVQGDFERLPFRSCVFDLIWMINALNHAADPRRLIETLIDAVCPGGVLAVTQSALLPDMMFAWDLRLERVVREACLRAYRDAYGLRETDTAGIRRIVGLFREARLLDVAVTTIIIERIAPLDDADERYLRETVFEGYWGRKLRPYLSRKDWNTLSALCDPASTHYALRRADFHHLQTLTLVRGRVPKRDGPETGA